MNRTRPRIPSRFARSRRRSRSGPSPTSRRSSGSRVALSASNSLSRPCHRTRFPTKHSIGPLGRPRAARAFARSKGAKRAGSTPFSTTNTRDGLTPNRSTTISRSPGVTATTAAARRRRSDRTAALACRRGVISIGLPCMAASSSATPLHSTTKGFREASEIAAPIFGERRRS